MLWKSNQIYQIFFTQSQILFEPKIGGSEMAAYRKPEWVTHMEEIQKRLNGKLKKNYDSNIFPELVS